MTYEGTVPDEGAALDDIGIEEIEEVIAPGMTLAE